ncbi:MAG: hypothetical protein M3R61_01795 [Chloroflexota bacterium]|nr:hypothetical protein [Chloroflexota bacterium]
MSSDTFNTKVHSGMRLISVDGVHIGNVWRVHFRDTEGCIEVRPYSFWNALLEGLALRQMQPASNHLFLPGHTITQVVGKRVHVRLNAEAVSACVSRPPWIERETYNDSKFNSGRPD